MNLPFRVFVFHHRRQIGSFEVCDLTSVTCDVNFFAKSLPVAVRVDKNVACLIPEFYTVTKIHKPTLVGRPIISGCNGPIERISAFVDILLQPVSTSQTSYNGHFRTHSGPVNLKIVISVELERVLFKYKF